ncbi:MAG TPA: glycosyltransferase family 2 protein [Thermoplasmata archaeon]|nr:glycosyltransferase family 2 protein [Thermoplasmata archaeon]
MSAPTAPRASIVLVGYNSAEVLGRCLDSLLAQDLPPSAFEVLFVDNASGDRTVDVVEGYRSRFPLLTLLRNERNLGFAPAVNQAAGRARAPVLVLLNPDTITEPSWLRELLAAFERNPAVALAGSRVLQGDGPGLYAAALEILYGGVCVIHEGDRRTDAVSGCALAVRTDVLRQLGGFAGELFMYGEDLDLGHRVRAAGHRIEYAPSSVAHHSAIRRERASSRTYMFYMARNRTLVCMRNYRRKRLYLLLDVFVLFPLTSLTEWMRSRAKTEALGWLFEARVDSFRESLRLLRAA